MRQFTSLIVMIALVFATPVAPAFAAGGGGSKSSGGGQSSRPNFITFPDLSASVLDGYRVNGLMVMGFGLEIEDSKLKKRAEALLPRLQDVFASEFNRYAGNTYHAGDLPDAEYVSKRMQATADRMLGKDKSVFLISFLVVR